MNIITDLYQLESSESLLLENFTNNKRKWEVVNIETEKAFIKDGYYHMENTSKSRWNYYKTKSHLKKGDDFIIETSIELEKKEDIFNHFGLVWGFNEERKYLNRFTLSADGKRALIMHFEKNHHIDFHRFQTRKLPKIDMNKSVRFSIIKLEDYFYFFINKVKVYTVHESVFCAKGFFVGYYIEPELSMKSDFFEVKKIKVKRLETEEGMQGLMSVKSCPN
jgi:hypothetical protein